MKGMVSKMWEWERLLNIGIQHLQHDLKVFFSFLFLTFMNNMFCQMPLNHLPH
ncbi:Uncharacterised protein [Serratia fonticola]|nr:Uncharacterised protein [Serratia fonticola]